MIGRSALGNPWFFKEAIALYKGEPMPIPPTINDRAAKCLRHLDQMVKFHGERIGINLMRKHFGWYIRGFESAGAIRKALVTAFDKDEMVDILETIN